MAQLLNAWHLQVDERIQLIRDTIKGNDSLREKVPGLASLLDDYLDEKVEVNKVDFNRRLLSVFKDSQADFTYEQQLELYTPDERGRIEEFVGGKSPLEKISEGFHVGPSLACRDELSHLKGAHQIKISNSGKIKEMEVAERPSGVKDFFRKIGHWFAEKLLDEDQDADILSVYSDAPFENWGRTVASTPRFTCIPKTVKAIQAIVLYAKENSMSVRCSGFRHSWAPVFGSNGQILISTLSMNEATHLPNITALPLPDSKPTELEAIRVIEEDADIKPKTPGNALVRVGCSTTNERFRRWCIDNKTLTYELNVIMVEITLGGSNAPICHGAGRKHQTLSDLVRKIEYVDVNGIWRSVTDPNHLRAASGCFGLMGVVTHITLELAPMTYANMTPEKIPVMRAVPPPPDMPDSQIPKPLFLKLTDDERKQDQRNFEEHAATNFYSEWFWFPYGESCWVNCWDNTTDPTGVVNYPDTVTIFIQFTGTVLMNVLQNTPLLDDFINATHLNEAAVTLISRAALYQLPSTPRKTYLTDALHFQRSIQNVRVRDVEVEMPLVPRADNPAEPDWSLVQRAWWDAILKAYEHNDTCPQRMPLEMRITADSNVIMAPQRYNSLGTCSIEILTLESARKIWVPYAQEVLDKWMSLTDSSGRRLKTRPHWAKEWKSFTVDGKLWENKLKTEDYKDEIVEFKQVLSDIGKQHGWTLSDLKARFSNEFFDSFIFDDVEASVGKTKAAPNGPTNGITKH